jgi:histidinol phosphatase-like enzyme
MTFIKKTKIICFDIDGVICNSPKNNYYKSIPIKKNIKKINQLYEQGYIIKIFTARFMGTTLDDINKSEKLAKKITINSLKKWGVKYHSIFFGKPSYDLFVDDKSIFFDKKWTKKIHKYLK